MSPTKRALSISINGYIASDCPNEKCSKIRKLKGCLNDAKIIYQLLVERFEFAPKQITQLHDNTLIKPTRKNILAAFNQLIETTEKEDVVVIHYSGHGGQLEEEEDKSKKCRRPNESKPKNCIETIVPIDSGRCELHPNIDITDEEIRVELLEKLSEKTSNITLLFDSCFSGHITRDPSGYVVRGVEPDVVSPGQLVGKTRGFRSQLTKHVLLAACRANEYAGERRLHPNANEYYGLWTLAFVKTVNLKIFQRKISHRDVFEIACADVVTYADMLQRQQHPLIEGPGERDLFGFEIIPAPKSYANVIALPEQNGQTLLQLNAGEAHGVTDKSQFAVYPLGCKNVDADVPHALVTVNQVESTTCTGFLSQPNTLVSVKIGCRAYEKFHAYTKLSMKVCIVIPPEMSKWLEKMDKNAAETIPTFIEQLKSFIEDCPQLKWSETAEGVDCEVHLIPPLPEIDDSHPIYSHLLLNRFNLDAQSILYLGPDKCTPDRSYSVLAKPTGIDLGPASNTLSSLGKYFRGLYIENSNFASMRNPIHGKIKFIIEWSPNQFTWKPVAHDGSSTLHNGDHIRVTITNESPLAIYIALIDFAEDGEVQYIYPPRSGHELVDPKQSLVTTFGPLEAASDLLPYETIKLFATTLPTDLTLLEQPAFRGACGSSLEELLTSNTSRKCPTPRTSDDFWTTDQIKFRIEKR